MKPTCPLCQKEFVTWSDLIVHLWWDENLHTNEGNVCPGCGKHFEEYGGHAALGKRNLVHHVKTLAEEGKLAEHLVPEAAAALKRKGRL